MNTSEEIVDPEDVNLNYTQGVRRDIASKLMKDGIPDDLEKLKTLIQVTDSMDRTSLGRKRIVNDKKALDLASMERDLIARMMTNPILAGVSLPQRSLPLVERVSEYKPNDGELGTSNGQIEYSDIYAGSPSGGDPTGEL